MILLKSCPRPANFTTSFGGGPRIAETNIDACAGATSIDGSFDESVLE